MSAAVSLSTILKKATDDLKEKSQRYNWQVFLIGKGHSKRNDGLTKRSNVNPSSSTVMPCARVFSIYPYPANVVKTEDTKLSRKDVASKVE